MFDATTFARTIADPTRQHIMSALCCTELCVSDVVDALARRGHEVSQPTVSHHLGALREAGLVGARRDGRQIFYSLDQEQVAMCCGVIMQRFAPQQEGIIMEPITSEATSLTIHQRVSQHYGDLARQVAAAPDAAAVSVSCCGDGSAGGASCCGPSSVTLDLATLDLLAPAGEPSGAIAGTLYTPGQVADLPASVTGISLGCGNPTALAGLRPGQTVLDLGSGGGIDCFLAARQVGPTGHVIGLDMTTDMVRLARRNAQKIGLSNVEFQWGEIEEIPLATDSVDVVISNCVINLSPDKPQVFREAYRVLRDGGELAVSDMVFELDIPQTLRGNLDAWAGCVAGAWVEDDYLAAIRAAGFREVTVVERDYLPVSQVFSEGDIQNFRAALNGDAASVALDRVMASIKVSARK